MLSRSARSCSSRRGRYRIPPRWCLPWHPRRCGRRPERSPRWYCWWATPLPASFRMHWGCFDRSSTKRECARWCRRDQRRSGPENSGTRTQWLRRLVEFPALYQVDVQLACYPPSHSKYNPIERVFGVLENYWNGDPLTSVDKAFGMSEGMTYKGIHPTAMLVEGNYPKGVKLDKKSMRPYEQCLQRLAELRKWFIKIPSSMAAATLSIMAN